MGLPLSCSDNSPTCLPTAGGRTTPTWQRRPRRLREANVIRSDGPRRPQGPVQVGKSSETEGQRSARRPLSLRGVFRQSLGGVGGGMRPDHLHSGASAARGSWRTRRPSPGRGGGRGLGEGCGGVQLPKGLPSSSWRLLPLLIQKHSPAGRSGAQGPLGKPRSISDSSR